MYMQDARQRFTLQCSSRADERFECCQGEAQLAREAVELVLDLLPLFCINYVTCLVGRLKK